MTSAELQTFIDSDPGAQAIVQAISDPLWLSTHLHSGFLQEQQGALNQYLYSKGLVDKNGHTDDGSFANLSSGGHVQKDPSIPSTWSKAFPYITLGVGGALAAPALFAGGAGAAGGGSAAGGATAAGGAPLAATTTAGGIGGLVPAAATVPSIGAGAGTAAGIGAGAAGAAEAGMLPSTTIGSGAVPGIAPTTGIGAGAAPAAAGGSGIGSFLKSLVPGLIPAATGLIGAGIESGAISDAAKTQLKGTEEALAQQKLFYEQQRGDLGPYRTTGYGALGNLQQLLGITPGKDTPDLVGQAPIPGQPAAAPGQGPSLASGLPAGFQQASGASPWLMNQLSKLHLPTQPQQGTGTNTGQPVLMRAPDGSTQQVQADQVQHYTQLGAQVVS